MLAMVERSGVVPPKVRAFRAKYKALHLRAWYKGWLHFAFTCLSCLAIMAWALSRLSGVGPAEWLVVPATLLFANGVEYAIHRGPMHHAVPGLGLMYREHTLRHHRFYTHDAMSAESSEDFKMVLFAPILLLGFIGGLAAPLALAVARLLSANAAWLFATTAVGYFLAYEGLHFSYHQPSGSFLARIPGMEALRRHHSLHHDPRLMSRRNFNVTFPIFDHLWSTRARPGAEPAAREGPASDLQAPASGSRLGA